MMLKALKEAKPSIVRNEWHEHYKRFEKLRTNVSALKSRQKQSPVQSVYLGFPNVEKPSSKQSGVNKSFVDLP